MQLIDHEMLLYQTLLLVQCHFGHGNIAGLQHELSRFTRAAL